MKFSIEVEFDNDANPLPGTQALLRKLLGLKVHPETFASKQEPVVDETRIHPIQQESSGEEQPRLGLPPSFTGRAEKPVINIQDKRSKPHLVPRAIPCSGGCGRKVLYRGNGIKPSCPECGGTGKVVGEAQIKEPAAPNITETPPNISNPRVTDPPAPKKLCRLCEQPLILKFGKQYCPNCAAYRELPEDQVNEIKIP